MTGPLDHSLDRPHGASGGPAAGGPARPANTAPAYPAGGEPAYRASGDAAHRVAASDADPAGEGGDVLGVVGVVTAERRQAWAPEPDPVARRRLGAEVVIVLGLSLGASGVYAVIDLIGKLTDGRTLAAQTATLNSSQSPRPYLDLTYQLVGIVFTLVPVALALWLLSANTPRTGRMLGLDRRRPLIDLAQGAGLAALIGLPGLALYFIGHALGVTATIVPAALDPHWWTVPVLILQAAKNAVLEEVIVVGYLVTRLQRLGWRAPAVLAASAVLRGSYHLYQGFGPFVGNAIMGLIFAQWYRRGGRVLPLIIAHTILDVVSFVGYDLFAGALGLK